jgi:hypothetical protein
LKANIRNIPRCLASGDIGTDEYHATITKDYITAAWNSGSVLRTDSAYLDLKVLSKKTLKIDVYILGAEAM